MSDTTESDKKKRLGLSRPGKLVLNKTVETGQVRQSFSRGRSKAVTVEVRKKRTYVPDADGRLTKLGLQADPAEEVAVETVTEADVEAAAQSARAPHLTSEEKAARKKALEEAIRAEAEARERAAREAEEEARRQAEEEERRQAEEEERAREEAERKAREEAEAAKAAAEAPVDSEPVTAETPAVEAVAPVAVAPLDAPKAADDAAPSPKKDAKKEAAKAKGEDEDEDDKARSKRPGRGDVKKAPAPVRRSERDRRRRSGKLTIADALDDEDGRTRSLAAVRRAREKEKQKQRAALKNDPQKIVRDVVIPEAITVQELASRMATRGAEVIKALFRMGVMATINQTIDADTAELIAEEFGHNVKRVSEADVEIGLGGVTDEDENLVPRPPVVTVMGHVDHGKTSVLDAIRKTDVVSGEAGGITQHIGAYQVTSPSGAKITFIDTPGHAAFTDMRARGAKVTDIVVLVVAADDGVMPQTIEAISHAKAAGVPLIIAINKMDLPGADPNRVRTELLQHSVVVEEMSGDVLTVEVSAKKGTNLDKLVETIQLQAEILDLKANPDRVAEGVVVESKVELGRGTVATVLVQRGTLRVGDIFVTGPEWGRVRAMLDDRGNSVEEAPPSVPVEVLGLNGTPSAGDDFVVVENEARAREISDFRQRRIREARTATSSRISLEQMLQQVRDGGTKQLPIVIKGDVHGSVEAIIGALEKISTDEVKVNVLHSGVGGINQSDITLAKASSAPVIGFNVRANPQAREMANRDGVEIRYYSIIYDAIDDLKKAMSGMLDPTLREKLLGYAQIREVFNITKVGKVGGCMITEGVVRRGAKVRLLRDDVVIHEGSLSQLKRFKDDVREVKEGYDCGMAFANYQDIQVGDFIECFEVEEIAREL